MTLRLGSLFSGVGGFDLGFERAGFEVAYQVEFDKHAQGVLKRHWPNVPLFEDVRNVTAAELPAVDVLVGGFPCQDLSVAGRRAGLSGARSGLFYEFARIIEETGPEWVVIENVPGLLSSRGGRDMGAVLGTLSELGYGWAYRVLDSQYFGVPQRRRRVFIVGRAGARSQSCAELLFEPESVLGNPPPSRTQGQEVAGSFSASSGSRGNGLGSGSGRGESDNLIVASGAYVLSERGREGGSATEIEWELCPTLRGADGGSSRSNRIARVASPLTASAGHGLGSAQVLSEAQHHHGHSSPRGDGSDNLVVGGVAVRTAQAGSNGWEINEHTAYTIDGANGQAVLAIEDPAGKMSGGPEVGLGVREGAMYSLGADPAHMHAVYSPAETTGTMTANWYKGPGNTQVEMGCIQPISGIVRRLTPKECERLQGFPDDWTAGQADSHRYRQMGNAVTVPVANWLASRIRSHA